MRRVRYGDRTASVKPAAGVRGVLCYSGDGRYFFRVYESKNKFTDYNLRHSDLEVTIAPHQEASFYRIDEDFILDHSPETLGLAHVGKVKQVGTTRKKR